MITRLLVYSFAMLSIAHAASITNGSFETGNFNNWLLSGVTANGAVYTAAQTDNVLQPTDGKYFAILSTGPGVRACCAADETTLEYPLFSVTEKGLNLSFDYNFLTAENNDGTGNPDFFSVMIDGKTTAQVVTGKVANGYPRDMIIPGGYLALPDGTALVWHTGVKQVTASLDDFVGQNVRFVFTIEDGRVEDNIDSALYIDNVRITQTPGQTPEPTTGYTAILGLLGIALLAWRRHRRSA